MKKVLFFIVVVCLSLKSYACAGYVVGFRGLDDVFDSSAFERYVSSVGYCGRVYSWNQDVEAVKFINGKYRSKPFHLYGYSRGAQTISEIVRYRRLLRDPELIITIGGHSTADLDFRKYKIDFIIFDRLRRFITCYSVRL